MALRKAHAPNGLREVVERENVRTLPGLLTQLRSGDVEQRRWATRDLASYPEATHAMGEQLLREHEASVREALFTSLAVMASEGAATALLPLLRSEDAQLRNGAIEGLSSMPQAVAPRVANLLRDSDPDVRIFTVNLLSDLRHDQVLPWLRQVLQHDANINVVAAAIEVLAEVGAPEDATTLRAARRRFAGDAFIGFAADMALERIESS